MILSLSVFETPMVFAGTPSPEGISNFPLSYQPYLNALHDKYPNWRFVALNTGLDWNAAITGESAGNASLVPTSFESSMKASNTQVEPGWVRASSGAIKYYMDPRNFLDEYSIFQFELLSYESDLHTDAGVDAILADTFMTQANTISYTTTSNTTSIISQSYITTIMDAAKTYKVSPYHLAARIRQEVILSGGNPSDSVTGKVPGYIGYYNFFNIGATNGTNPVLNGLAYAKTSGTFGRPWDSPAKAINGGAQFIANGYINVGQDSLYLQKFNVSPAANGSPVYTHQYMQNLAAPSSEAVLIHEAYGDMGLLSQSKVFYIPVYNKMPEFPCYRPSTFSDSDSSLYYLSEATVNVRTGPGTGYSILGSFYKGTTVQVITWNVGSASGYNWAHVKLSDGRTGYVANAFLIKRMATAGTLKVEDDNANLTYCPGWTIRKTASLSGGSAHQAGTDMLDMSFAFTGSQLSIVGTGGAKRGKINVYLDGATEPTQVVDCAGASAFQVKFATITTTEGSHKVRLEMVIDSAASTVEIDRFEIKGVTPKVSKWANVSVG